ncbi:pleckstrin-2-like isoform X2 [Apostichopus japonicus]
MGKRVLIKEGFLVKKGHVRTNWRTRWFALYDDVLLYYKKKGDKLAAGAVPLKGCSVLSPCPMYQKKKSVFQVSSRISHELLIQAHSDAERDEWAQAIGDAIKACDRLKEQQSSHTGVDLNELITALQDQGAGIKLKEKTVNNVLYTNCFSGHDLIEWLIEWSFAETPEESIALATSLVAEAHLQPLARCKSLEECRKIFFDDDTLYKFSAYNLGDLKRTFDESSDSEFSSEEESESEEKKAQPKTTGPTARGKIVKQGFLIKRGHMRHTWKARLFVLWDNPPLLQYYKGSKVSGEKPLGEVPIRWCTVNTVEQTQDSEVTVKNKARVNLFSVVTQKGKMFVLQASTPEEREDWMRAIMSPADAAQE